MTQAIQRSWANRLSKVTFWLGLGSGIVAAFAAYGSGFGLWHFSLAFLAIGIALLAAVIAVLIGIPALLMTRGRHALIGLLAAIAFLAVIGYWINRGVSVPPLHDISTDLVNPPTFKTLPLRADNLVGVDTIETWRALHAKAYGDIKPINMAKTTPEAMGIVKRLIEERGWKIAAVGLDRIEATETQSPFRFKDDVVVVAAPENEGRTTRIDIRSVSQVGVSDLGVNAERVRALIADIKAADRATP
jgi:uncharacterized protein (DUF1499 family)